MGSVGMTGEAAEVAGGEGREAEEAEVGVWRVVAGGEDVFGLDEGLWLLEEGGTGEVDECGDADEADFVEAADLGPAGTVSFGLTLLAADGGVSFPLRMLPLCILVPLLKLAVAAVFIMSDSILLHARVSMANGLLLASNCVKREESKIVSNQARCDRL